MLRQVACSAAALAKQGVSLRVIMTDVSTPSMAVLAKSAAKRAHDGPTNLLQAYNVRIMMT